MSHYFRGGTTEYYATRPITKMAWFLTGDMYRKQVVDDNGKFVSDRPWFITFVRMAEPAAEMNA